jgi:hypothetical protein
LRLCTRHEIVHALALLFALLAVNSAGALNPAPAAAALPQSDSDALFNQAVDAYKQNQFTPALQKFQQVTGAHAQEAQQYIRNINSYRDAMSAAKGILDRSADERDERSLAFAIDELEEAIKIKSDGPWQPAQMLEQARALKAEIEKTHAETSKAADRGFCDKAVAAAQEHRYKEAAQFSCLLADDNPGYSCGGDEAVHMCELNNELAKMDKTAITRSDNSGTHASGLDKAKAAYDSNNFERARSLFQQAGGESKAAAGEFLDKIFRYSDALSNGTKLAHDGKYEEARTAFLSAAAIKSDGPGDPQSRASKMELLLGLDQFYSGDYVSATQHLENCSRSGVGDQSLVRFYLGASKLARFFLTGGEDSALHQEALNDLKLAKQAGFKSAGQDVSPKILQAYKDLSY